MHCIGLLIITMKFTLIVMYIFVQVGSATAIGEQPVKGLIDPACGARMSVGEALTNLVFAKVSALKVNSYILYRGTAGEGVDRSSMWRKDVCRRSPDQSHVRQSVSVEGKYI